MNIKQKNFILFLLTIILVNGIYSQTSHTVIIGEGGSFTFSPTNLTIAPGDTVNWEWEANNHSTTSDAITGLEVWDSGVLNSGATFSRIFTQEGIHSYHCTPHQAFGMVGTITVETSLGVNDNGNKAVHFQLDQNSPNPFNPSTNINYSLSLESKVKLTIYDIIGNEVKSLVNSNMPEGQYSIEWNGTNNQGSPVPSGTYIYSLESDNKTQSMKMILLR